MAEQFISKFDGTTSDNLLDAINKNQGVFPFDTELNETSPRGLPNSVIAKEINAIKDATSNNKGYFLTEEALKNAYPVANNGSKAYVGENYPYKIYLYQSGLWTDSGQTGGDDSFNAGEFYTRTEIDQQHEVINNQIVRVEKGANYEVLEYETSIATTRLKVEEDNRKGGYMITYNSGTGWIKEQYIGELTDNEEWIKDENWKAEVLDENIQAIAENVTLAQQTANTAQQSADAAQQLADVTAANCGFVVAVDFNGGTLHDKIPKELRKPGLIVEYESSSVDDKITFKAERFIGKDVSDEFWFNSSYWEEVFKEPTPYVLTSSKIYDVLPKGSILQSAYGNIFGEKWAPMENVLGWDLSGVEEIDGTAIKGQVNAIYAKGYYYCYGIGMGILYSSDLNTWNIADLRGDGQNYHLFSLTYSKSNDTLFATAVVDENDTVKSYYSKDGVTWNEYTVGNAVIVGFVVSGNNTMLAAVIDGTSGKMKYYIADGTDIESVSWSLLSDIEYTATLYSAGHIYFDDTRGKYITITGDGIYEKDDDTTSLLEFKSPLPENIAMPELSANDKDNTYILRSQWDIHRFTYIAKNKDTTTWEEFKVQVSTDGEMLSSFVFSIKDIYYVLLPATFVGGALDNITFMGYPVFEYAVTDGENFIGFNFTEGKIYRTKLAQALEPVQYGYIKIK